MKCSLLIDESFPIQFIFFLFLFVFGACQHPETPLSISKTPAIDQLTPDIDSLINDRLSEADKLADQGNLEEARQHLNTTLANVQQSAGDYHPQTASVQHALGNLYNNHFQDRQKAIPHFQEAVNIRKALLSQRPALDVELAKSYFALARVQRLQGRYHAAIENIQQCLLIRENAEPFDSLRVGWTYFEAGVIYQQSGDLQNALHHLGQAIALSTHKSDLANAWNETASTYDLLFQPDKAVEFYKKAYDLYTELEYWWPMGSCLVNLGGAYLRNEDYDQAFKTLLKARELNQQLIEADPDDTDVRLARGAIVSNLGILYKRRGQLDKALEAAKESLSIAMHYCGTAYHPEVASSYDNLGNVYAEKEAATEALIAYKNGIQSIVPYYKPITLFENPALTFNPVSEKPLLLTLLYDKAKALDRFATQQEDPLAWEIAAFNTYQTIDTLLVLTRQSCREDGSKYFLAKESGPIYEQAIDRSFALWQQTRNPVFRDAILSFSERNKAGVLLESLNDALAKKHVRISDHSIAEEQNLQQAIARQEIRLYQSTQNGRETEPLRDSLFHLKRKMERLIRSMEQSSPAYFEQKFALSQIPSPEAFQNKLSAGKMLIAYYLGVHNLYTIAITRESFRIYKVPVTDHFLDKIQRFRQAVSDYDYVKNHQDDAAADFLNSSHSLFEILLQKPLAETDKNITSLVIVPDGILGYLSFDAMLTRQVPNWKSRNLPYLLKEYAVSYAYAASFLLKPPTKQASVPKAGFAGFGLEYDEQTLHSVTLPKAIPVNNQPTTNLSGNLGKLPYSAREVADLAELMGGRSWLNKRATRTNFLRYAPDASIIHFAGHGFTDVQQPLNSSLLFTKTTDTTECFLRAADLYGRPLKARLAVLSACNTGNGDLQEGEGIMSFARAFAYAGVPSLVMSLWSITDASTADIMKSFYSELKMGEMKDEALRRAKLNYLENTTPEHALPVYWAGTVLMGDDAPLDNHRSHWIFYTIGLSVFFGGFWLWMQQRKRTPAGKD